jgi:hypothetical protein
METAASRAGDAITIANRACPGEHLTDILGGSLDALPRRVSQTRRFPLGVYRGLRFGLVLHPQFAPEAYLEGATTRQSLLSHHGPRAILNAVERLAGGYGSECARVQQDLAIAQSQLRDYQARLGAPFAHESYLSALTALRDQLKAGLSGAAPEAGAAPLPTVSELAERIKALKGAHTIEATPERVGKRRSSAEEPVTARIRRRIEALPAFSPFSPALEPDAAASEPGTSPPPESTALSLPGEHTPSGAPSPHTGTARDVSSKLATTYRQRAAKSR